MTLKFASHSYHIVKRLALIWIFLRFTRVQSSDVVYRARIVATFVRNRALSYSYDYVAPAVRLATEKARINYPDIDFELALREGSPTCETTNAAALAAEEYYLRNITAFVGPGCSQSLDQVARMASHWNIPVYTASGVDDSFTDKTIYPTLTRLSFSMDRVSDFFRTIFEEFHWRHVTLLVDESDPQNRLAGSSLEHTFKKNTNYEYFIDTLSFMDTENHPANLTAVLRRASLGSRVMVILASGEMLQRILLRGFELGMGAGDYAFLNIEMIRDAKSNSHLVWRETGGLLFYNQKLRKMYESLMVVSIRVPTSSLYSKFVKDMVEATRDTDFPIEEDSVSPLLSAYHDAVLLYAWALNRTLSLKEDPRDGQRLARRAWNNTFLGVLRYEELTGNIFINENGDREADFTLNDFDPEFDKMRPVATYFGDGRVYEPCNSIHWPGQSNEPTLDIPLCGFTGDSPSCNTFGSFPVTVVVVVAVSFLALLTALFILMFVYRRIIFEAQLADFWWKVRYEDIVIQEKYGFKSAENLYAGLSEDGTWVEMNSKVSMMSNIALEGNINGVKIGIYKGIKVVLKRLSISKPTIPRDVLMELKQMREVNHENLVRFVGLCTDDPNIVILTELCHRGSLQGLLSNESMKIDWDFRYSMISDLVEGMTYLHNSFISYHGRLKSTNCVVDRRFVVKITDYGLRTFLNQEKLGENANPRVFLWCSPEALRTNNPFANGSKKGDVYSFAIILQEIVTRTGPYEALPASSLKRLSLSRNPQNIIHRVKLYSLTPFRPELDPEDGPAEVLELMKQCWAENPDERPSFPEIMSEIKRITKGISNNNLLERLLHRMEQYANNLETLVNEKTQSIIEEKKKTDELLYQLLPKYVAEELKNGRHVKPESFESVTVFFSDVVGFTPLAAESKPMEVVDLLNDLYSCFDSIIENYNVYKVETIGDAYMVVSGLPVKNGNEHAREIARMSLSLLKAMDTFKIRHRKEKKLQLRIGIHSGACAAGVVGIKMPKYCLFGDTVNTASRMESNGEAMRIHVSHDTKRILDLFGTFRIKLRGDIPIKGKGIMRTYWLLGETGEISQITNQEVIQ